MHRDTIYYDSREYPQWGRFYAAASEKGLCLLRLPGEGPESFYETIIRRYSPNLLIQDQNCFQAFFGQLGQYLKGLRKEFQVAIDLEGTPFQIMVWEKVKAIPYGQTRSYGDIAQAIGRPASARAVGRANQVNPLPIIVPCHRVIGADGALVGYGGGLALKEKLLNLERKY